MKTIDNADDTTAPAGSTPASGSRTRGAGRKPDAPLTSDSARPFPDQATGALDNLEIDLEGEAAEFASYATDTVAFTAAQRKAFAREAAEKRRQLAALRDLRRALRAQSDRSEDERCPECRSWLGVTTNADGNLICPSCKTTWAPGVGVERSGSGNDPAQAAPHPTENDE